MKYYYYKNYLEQGQDIPFCAGCFDHKLSEEEIEKLNKTLNNLFEDTIIFESEMPLTGYPIFENGTIRQATDVELIKMGKRKLKEGELIENDEIIKIERPSYQYDWDFQNLKWIPNENLMYDGQYIENGEIIAVPNVEDYLIPAWNKDTHTWYEGATEEEFIKMRTEKILKYSELEKNKTALENSKFSSVDEIKMITEEMAELEKEINLLAEKIKTFKI